MAEYLVEVGVCVTLNGEGGTWWTEVETVKAKNEKQAYKKAEARVLKAHKDEEIAHIFLYYIEQTGEEE